MTRCYSHYPGVVALSLDGKERQKNSAHNLIDTGNLLSIIWRFSVMCQRQCTYYLPSCTYYGTYVPCSPYTYPEYHDTAHSTLLTQMCDKLTDSDNQPTCFLVSSPLDVSDYTFALPLVLVDLWVHMYSVRSARYLHISSSAWSACLRRLRASRVFCLIFTLFAPNTWLTAPTSLHLLPCQFLLRLFLATFLCCCFWTFFGMSRSQIPVPARWLNSLVLSCLFLIMFSCSSRRSSWRPPCTTT